MQVRVQKSRNNCTQGGEPENEAIVLSHSVIFMPKVHTCRHGVIARASNAGVLMLTFCQPSLSSLSTVYTSKKTFQTVPFKRSRGDRAFCLKGPFNLAMTERQRALNYTARATGARISRIPPFQIDTCVVVFCTPEIEQELKRVF